MPAPTSRRCGASSGWSNSGKRPGVWPTRRGKAARFANAAAGGGCEAYYWRERNREVDFVVRAGERLVAVEVKSGRVPDALPGMTAFAEAFRPTRKLLVGGDGIDVEAVLLTPVEKWLGP